MIIQIAMITDNASKFVDVILMPYVTGTLQICSNIYSGFLVPLDALIVAVDIEALYSSIPHERGVRMAESFFMAQDQITWALNGLILKLFRIYFN